MNYVYVVSAHSPEWTCLGETRPAKRTDLCVVIAPTGTRAKAIAAKHSQYARDYEYVQYRVKRVEPLQYLDEGVTLDEEGWQWDFEDPDAEVRDLRRWLEWQI